MAHHLQVAIENWPMAGSFAISRGAKTEAVVVIVTISDGDKIGRGECVPYNRYGETVEGVVSDIRAMEGQIADAITHEALGALLPAGAARNALNCALIDLEAKKSGRRAAEMLGLPPLFPVDTAYTLSLGTPESMGDAARLSSHRSILKLKLGGDGDPQRIEAVRAGAPDARLIVDANEAWSASNFAANMSACIAAGVELIEQPLPVGADDLLATIDRPIPICADESVHVSADLDDLTDRYDAVNIKLDKAGGLTEALSMLRAAEAKQLKIMVGCMVGTSLAMAPALLLAQRADFVDLDGPLLLVGDREPGLRYEGSTVYPPSPELWG